jgi:hypothetical protein
LHPIFVKQVNVCNACFVDGGGKTRLSKAICDAIARNRLLRLASVSLNLSEAELPPRAVVAYQLSRRGDDHGTNAVELGPVHAIQLLNDGNEKG